MMTGKVVICTETLRLNFRYMKSTLSVAHRFHNSTIVTVHPQNVGRATRKSAFDHTQNCADLHHPGHAQSIIWAFALHSYIL